MLISNCEKRDNGSAGTRDTVAKNETGGNPSSANSTSVVEVSLECSNTIVELKPNSVQCQSLTTLSANGDS